MSWLNYDPPEAASRKDAEADEWLKSRPVCAHCGEHIQDDYMYEHEGEYYCEECFDWYVKEEVKVPID